MTNERTTLLIGEENAKKLQDATVLVVGTGGVGGMAVESLARSGVGCLILIDRDIVEASNTNRQLAALTDTVGEAKVQVLADRIHRIDPGIHVIPIHEYYDRDMNERLDALHPDFVLDCIDSLRAKEDLIEYCTSRKIPFVSSMGMARRRDPSRLDALHPDFVLDCIDSLRAKEDLIEYCTSRKIPFVSSMGMARRRDPSRLGICELEKTAGDPLAKRLRIWRRKKGIRETVRVCCSSELPGPAEAGSPLPSMMFVPAAAGLIMAAECVQVLTEAETGRTSKERKYN